MLSFLLLQGIDENSPAYRAGSNLVFALVAVAIIVGFYTLWNKRKK